MIHFAANPQFETEDGLSPFAKVVGHDVPRGTQPGWMRIDTTQVRADYLRDVARLRNVAISSLAN
jgi:hypothetical protein